MANIITVEHINKTKFYQLPKAFFHNSKYMKMKNETKIAYALLRDLLELSIENNWINSNNEVYVKLSRKKLMERLNIKGTAKMTEIIKELKDHELIVENRLGLKQVNEIYICTPDELSKIYSDKELLTFEDTLTFENQNSKPSKIEAQELSKSKAKTFENQRHTKTNITKTNITKTNYTTQRELACSKLESPNKDLIEKETKNNTTQETCACSVVDNPNKDLIEQQTHLTLTPNQSKKVSKWDIKKIYKAIELFKRENGEYFTLLDKIYNDSRNFAPNVAKRGKFNSFSQREYDMEDLERKLLGWD